MTAHDIELVNHIASAAAGGHRFRALEMLFTRHAAMLHSTARRMTLSDYDSEEVLLRARRNVLEKAHTFRAYGTVASWLRTIVHNAAIDVIRHRKREFLVGSDDPAALPHSVVPGHAAPSPDITAAVRIAMDHLPPPQRRAILLADVHGYSVEEIAELEGVATGTIKSRRARARAELRELLDPNLGTFDDCHAGNTRTAASRPTMAMLGRAPACTGHIPPGSRPPCRRVPPGSPTGPGDRRPPATPGAGGGGGNVPPIPPGGGSCTAGSPDDDGRNNNSPRRHLPLIALPPCSGPRPKIPTPATSATPRTPSGAPRCGARGSDPTRTTATSPGNQGADPYAGVARDLPDVSDGPNLGATTTEDVEVSPSLGPIARRALHRARPSCSSEGHRTTQLGAARRRRDIQRQLRRTNTANTPRSDNAPSNPGQLASPADPSRLPSPSDPARLPSPAGPSPELTPPSTKAGRHEDPTVRSKAFPQPPVSAKNADSASTSTSPTSDNAPQEPATAADVENHGPTRPVDEPTSTEAGIAHSATAATAPGDTPESDTREAGANSARQAGRPTLRFAFPPCYRRYYRGDDDCGVPLGRGGDDDADPTSGGAAAPIPHSATCPEIVTPYGRRLSFLEPATALDDSASDSPTSVEPRGAGCADTDAARDCADHTNRNTELEFEALVDVNADPECAEHVDDERSSDTADHDDYLRARAAAMAQHPAGKGRIKEATVPWPPIPDVPGDPVRCGWGMLLQGPGMGKPHLTYGYPKSGSAVWGPWWGPGWPPGAR